MKDKNPKRNVKNFRFNIMLLIVAFLITVLVVLTGAYVQEGYDVSVNTVSPYRFKAPRKVENTVATQRVKKAAMDAAEKMDPVTERNTDVNDKVLENLEVFFEKVVLLRKEYENQMNLFNSIPDQNEEGEMAASKTQGNVPVAPTPSPPELPTMPIHLNENMTELILTMETADFDEFAEQIKALTGVILDGGIYDLEAKSLLSVREETESLDLKADMKTLAYEIIASFLEPNIVINEESTKKARDERAADYEPLYYLENQTIVDEGHIITEESFVALEALGLVKKGYTENIVLVIGVVVLIASVFSLIVMYLFYYQKNNISRKKESLLILTLYLTVILLSRVLIGIPYQMLPIMVFAMLIATLFDSRMAIVLNLGVSVICLLIFKGDLEFLFYFLFTGIFVSLVSKYTTERNMIIMVALMTSVACVIIYLGTSVFFAKGYSEATGYGALYAAGSGVFTVIVCIGSAPLWEGLFGIVTPFRLLDLTNPNTKLLRRLTIEAPGTYHHCLIVANLSETAAYDIGANPNLARAGAYYHDIGKLKYPQYFAENQVGENIHDTMEPYSSTKVIMSHVPHGLELAEKNKIPHVIRDIIEEHHGNTLVKYFYYKEKNENPEVEIHEEDYRYGYSIPQSKESAIVMLADTVEAAVRSMIPTGKSVEEVEVFVRKLVKDKLDDGQLNDSNLTIRDIETIIKSFLLVFKGMYHERIPYPTAEKPKGES